MAASSLIIGLSSCDKSDPQGTASFNRDIIKKYMFKRAADHEKRPIIIDAISDTQRIKLHGEELLTSAVSVQGDGLAQHYTMYFVARPDGSHYLSGGTSLLEEIDRD